MIDKNHNVLFITVDSTSFQCALNAKTPFLDSIGPKLEAETVATFTYPAHHAFFIGHLPRPTITNYYFQDYKYIWRSAFNRHQTEGVAVSFHSKNVIEHYIEQNYSVRGFGGVSFFNKFRGSTLTEMFPNFTYFGLEYIPSTNKIVPRPPQFSPFNNINQIVEGLDSTSSYFIFINCPETHISYDYPGAEIPNGYTEALSRLYEEHYRKHKYDLDKLPFTVDEINMFKNMQVKSLEWIDTKISELVNKLPNNRPLLILVCGDHGEEFGEGGRFGHGQVHPTVLNVPLWSGLIFS